MVKEIHDSIFVTMRSRAAAREGVRLNIGLAEQRPNPFRDKCKVSEAHLLWGPRFNNWHYNSISHHYLAALSHCNAGVGLGKAETVATGKRWWKPQRTWRVNCILSGTVYIPRTLQCPISATYQIVNGKALLFSPMCQRICQGGWGRCFDWLKESNGRGLLVSHWIAQ